jgi:hypothetical protein
MGQARQLDLNVEQEQELQKNRDHHDVPYMRVKCAALLKIASGESARSVALTGLLKPIDPETVSRWIDLYQTEGLSGLLVHKGRGRKPAFSPSEGGAGQRADRRTAPPSTSARWA